MFILVQESAYEPNRVLLNKMYQLRKAIFFDELQWDVSVDEAGERDRYDDLGPAYLIWCDEDRETLQQHDIELSTPATEIHRIEYELPRGYTFSRVPKGADFEIPEASFHLEIRESGAGKALVESRLVYRKHRITAGDYRAFREFLRQVDETLAQSFEIRPGR